MNKSGLSNVFNSMIIEIQEIKNLKTVNLLNLNSNISESFSQFNSIEDVKPDLHEIIAKKKKKNMKLLLSKKSQIKNLDENSPSVFRMNYWENPIYNIEKYDIKGQINKNYEFIDNSRSSKKVERLFLRCKILVGRQTRLVSK
jgi:hypothetical protein